MSNLKEYVVSEENYEGAFGTKPVIKASSTEGKDRCFAAIVGSGLIHISSLSGSSMDVRLSATF